MLQLRFRNFPLMPAEEGQPDDQPRVTGQVPPPAPTTGLEQILPGRPPLPHAEEKGAFFVYQRELAPGTRLEQYEIIRVLCSMPQAGIKGVFRFPCCCFALKSGEA